MTQNLNTNCFERLHLINSCLMENKTNNLSTTRAAK